MVQSLPRGYQSLGRIGRAICAAGLFDSEAGDLRLEIFNILGRKVEVLTEGELEAGEHALYWDASSYASGVYLYRITNEEDDPVEIGLGQRAC